MFNPAELRVNRINNNNFDERRFIMFIVIINFPPIKEGKDAEFREWFAWSNEVFAKQEGLIKRRLLKPLKEGNYAAVVEHESYESFMALHSSAIHEEAGNRVKKLFEGLPTPHFYEVILG
jgi:heme-degrading monooxygenase HmoA